MPDGGQIIEKLEDIENEVSGSDVEELEKKAEREGYSVAHSPVNKTSPYVLVTLVLVFFITLRVFGFI
jgi:hypothetical protein